MNLAIDIGSFIDAGRLFHNTDPLNFNKRLPKEAVRHTTARPLRPAVMASINKLTYLFDKKTAFWLFIARKMLI